MKKRIIIIPIFLLIATICGYKITGLRSTAQPVLSDDFKYKDQIEVGNLDNNRYSDPILNYEQVGDQQDFWFMNWGIEEYKQAHATLLAVGKHCYVYMDNLSINIEGEEWARNRCKVIKNEFDDSIYPANYDLIGNPDGILGDIDGDRHITIFLGEHTAAYYDLSNELPGYPHSNHREMVYSYSRADIYEIIGDVCHETNHLFFFNYDQEDAVFLFEGLAEYSKFHAGYLSNDTFRREGVPENWTISTTYFADTPYLSLFCFDEHEPVGGYGSYGFSYLFMFYFVERFGSDIISDIVAEERLDGAAAIELALSNSGYNITFNEIYLDFITACTIDKIGNFDNIYGFENLNFKVEKDDEISSFPTELENIKHRYYGIVNEKIWELEDEFTIQLETPVSTRSLGVVIAIFDENGWNITEMILPGEEKMENLHCNGLNISEVYLITSLIKEVTPSPILSFMSTPYSVLDICIEQGHIYLETDITEFFIYISILSILTIIFLVKKKVIFR